MEGLKTTKVIVEITANFDEQLAVSLAKKKAHNNRTSKAKEIVRLAEVGYKSEIKSNV